MTLAVRLPTVHTLLPAVVVSDYGDYDWVLYGLLLSMCLALAVERGWMPLGHAVWTGRSSPVPVTVRDACTQSQIRYRRPHLGQRGQFVTTYMCQGEILVGRARLREEPTFDVSELAVPVALPTTTTTSDASGDSSDANLFDDAVEGVDIDNEFANNEVVRTARATNAVARGGPAPPGAQPNAPPNPRQKRNR